MGANICIKPYRLIQIYSGITSGRVPNGELYTQRLQKLTYLYLSTGCLVKMSLHSSGREEGREIFMKQPAGKYR